jgi:hypothetical protein
MRTLRIGNGCGFWGDSVDAPVRLAEDGQLDYLTLEYLAELTMSILALLKQRDANAGYATDFLDVLARLVPNLKSQPKLKIVTNAGGMNSRACAMQAKDTLAKHGCSHRVGIVTGDDLMPNLNALLANGHTLSHLDTGAPLATVRSKVVSANAYLGSLPIAEALKLGASIVITGRVADACLTVGPLMHEYGWHTDDQLAVGTVAGHLIECGAQVTGGLWMNADDSTNLAEVGYPIAEIDENGTFRITKPANTGGAVNIETVSEQLLYEVADPARYFTPDVVADFTSVQLREVTENSVEVSGSRGRPATDTYKVSIAYRDGYTSSGTLVLAGENAEAKARKSGEILLARLKNAGYTFAHSHIEVIGEGREVTMRVAVRDADKKAVERFTKEFAPLVTSGYAGTTGYTTGRAAVREVFAYWPALIAKSAVQPQVELI